MIVPDCVMRAESLLLTHGIRELVTDRPWCTSHMVHCQNNTTSTIVCDDDGCYVNIKGFPQAMVTAVDSQRFRQADCPAKLPINVNIAVDSGSGYATTPGVMHKTTGRLSIRVPRGQLSMIDTLLRIQQTDVLMRRRELKRPREGSDESVDEVLIDLYIPRTTDSLTTFLNKEVAEGRLRLEPIEFTKKLICKPVDGEPERCIDLSIIETNPYVQVSMSPLVSLRHMLSPAVLEWMDRGEQNLLEVVSLRVGTKNGRLVMLSGGTINKSRDTFVIEDVSVQDLYYIHYLIESFSKKTLYVIPVESPLVEPVAAAAVEPVAAAAVESYDGLKDYSISSSEDEDDAGDKHEETKPVAADPPSWVEPFDENRDYTPPSTSEEEDSSDEEDEEDSGEEEDDEDDEEEDDEEDEEEDDEEDEEEDEEEEEDDEDEDSDDEDKGENPVTGEPMPAWYEPYDSDRYYTSPEDDPLPDAPVESQDNAEASDDDESHEKSSVCNADADANSNKVMSIYDGDDERDETFDNDEAPALDDMVDIQAPVESNNMTAEDPGDENNMTITDAPVILIDLANPIDYTDDSLTDDGVAPAPVVVKSEPQPSMEIEDGPPEFSAASSSDGEPEPEMEDA